MPNKSKREQCADRKFSQVAREYRAGTLNIGKSNKKVTNPHQMKAIALKQIREKCGKGAAPPPKKEKKEAPPPKKGK